MDIFDDIKNQMKGQNSNMDDTGLPWISEPDKPQKDGEAKTQMGTKKLATIGLCVLIVAAVGIAVFNYINNNNTVKIDNNEASADENINKQIQVHVAGEVNKPGVYKLDEGSRIMDAVNAAGGFTDKADKNSLNLAKTLEDGVQIMINSIDSALQNTTTQGSTQNNGKININLADLSQLQTLNGVGPATAQKIIDYRNANGKFKTIEDIKKVSGIGEKTYEKFKDQICV